VSLPQPTNPHEPVGRELRRWSRIFAGDEYYYGEEPGPLARRTVRYHRPGLSVGAAALDLGCGEGQDLAFLAECGYAVTGVEFTEGGARKAKRLLEARGLAGVVVRADLRTWTPTRRHDLVLAANSLQFLGADAAGCLARVMDWVAPGGVLGLSLFAREPGEPAVEDTVAFFPVTEILDRFAGWQRMEASHLWQWDVSRDQAQPFVTMIARKAPAAGVALRVG